MRCDVPDDGDAVDLWTNLHAEKGQLLGSTASEAAWLVTQPTQDLKREEIDPLGGAALSVISKDMQPVAVNMNHGRKVTVIKTT